MLVISWRRKGKWPKNKVKYKINELRVLALGREHPFFWGGGGNMKKTLADVTPFSPSP